jgi:hypothetical protein
MSTRRQNYIEQSFDFIQPVALTCSEICPFGAADYPMKWPE